MSSDQPRLPVRFHGYRFAITIPILRGAPLLLAPHRRPEHTGDDCQHECRHRRKPGPGGPRTPRDGSHDRHLRRSWRRDVCRRQGRGGRHCHGHDGYRRARRRRGRIESWKPGDHHHPESLLPATLAKRPRAWRASGADRLNHRLSRYPSRGLEPRALVGPSSPRCSVLEGEATAAVRPPRPPHAPRSSRLWGTDHRHSPCRSMPVPPSRLSWRVWKSFPPPAPQSRRHFVADPP